VKRVLACAALAVVLLAAPAAAQQYPPAVNSLTISDTTPTPGQTITIEGRTFAPGSTVTVTMESVTLGTAVANDSGVFTLQATIPIDTSLGRHTITATGQAPDGAALVLSATITVVAPDGEGGAGGAGDAGSSGALPRTGDDTSLPLAKLGLGLLVVGGLVTAIAAKRRKAALAS
jgi:LPXTG-motif cell wall-anchored protein